MLSIKINKTTAMQIYYRGETDARGLEVWDGRAWARASIALILLGVDCRAVNIGT